MKTKYPKVVIQKSAAKDVIVVEEKDLVNFDPANYDLRLKNGGEMAAIRNSGNLKNKAIWLNNNYNWQVVIDNEGVTCLMPTKKM